MSRVIYIASPYSNPDPAVTEENFKKVSRLAAKLCSEGKVAISPITYGHTLVGFRPMPIDWPFWENFCLSILHTCHEIIVYKMEGWDSSRGVAEEVEFARKKGIEISYLEYDPSI
jgi:hypothetical protein